MKKFVSLVVSSVLVAGLLTGCGSNAEIQQLNEMQALNSEASVKENYSLSYTNEQQMIYQQVSDRTLLDLSGLSKCSEDELQQVVNYLNSVDNQLIGATASDDTVIDECFTSYLLAEFEKTPYYWQRTGAVIRGIDAESRSIVVDVTYKTIDFDKTVQLPSKIVKGSPEYDKKMEVRYERWINLLDEKYRGTNLAVDYEAEYNEFVSIYGEPEDILASQSKLTLTENIFETGNQKTYQGLIDSTAESCGGTMTVRYVLVPHYVLGVNLGITCEHMYVLNYAIDTDITSDMTLFTEEGYSTVTDSVYDLIYSYFQCIDENDFDGLYKLTTNFGNLDMYYQDLFDTTYMKHGNFTISLFDIVGTHITCGVTVSSKVRAKGSNMTYPSYTDRYYAEIELVDGMLKVDNFVLLSRSIEGEPAITADDVDMSGFTQSVDLTNDDRQSIEHLICNFGALQLLGDTTSDDFSNTVDISISEADLNVLKTAMTSLSGAHKVVWLQNYRTGSTNYASVKCRELFQASDNSIVEASTVYDFIYKGGKWYIYGYLVDNEVKLDTTNLQATGSLALISPGKVESYTSQVQGTASTSQEVTSDTSVSYTYEAYTPTLKTGTTEQGRNTTEAYHLDDATFADYLGRILTQYGNGMEQDEFYQRLDEVYAQLVESASSGTPEEGVVSTDVPDIRDSVNNMVAVYYNIANNRYTGVEGRDAWNKHLNEQFTVIQSLIAQLRDSLEDRDQAGRVDEFYNVYSSLIRNIGNYVG